MKMLANYLKAVFEYGIKDAEQLLSSRVPVECSHAPCRITTHVDKRKKIATHTCSVKGCTFKQTTKLGETG